ncbi:nucleolar RNA-binding Nop10p family protein [Candidatus Woesearchaeota archaeon]|nr:nucleolar RNA-binding Nop10p family protein [Candidatus Woesearchaeota archaeon]
MSKEIFYCSNCKKYTLEKICNNCKKETLSPKPAKFSPLDKYGKYRRIYKKQMANQSIKENK